MDDINTKRKTTIKPYEEIKSILKKRKTTIKPYKEN